MMALYVNSELLSVGHTGSQTNIARSLNYHYFRHCWSSHCLLKCLCRTTAVFFTTCPFELDLRSPSALYLSRTPSKVLRHWAALVDVDKVFVWCRIYLSAEI